jgi:CRP-like cAMP-binding protein
MATTMMRAVGRKIDGELLGQVPIFGGLSPQILDRIIDAGSIGDVPAGAQVIAEGDPARSVFVVCEGELEIRKRGAQGSEVRLAVLRVGDCVGEMSLIDIQPRSASVCALTPAVLFRLGHAEIGKLYQTQPEVYTLLVLNIAREISRRLRVADKVLADLGVVVPELWAGRDRTHRTEPT